MMNSYLNLTLENLEQEHIGCAIGDPKHKVGVDQKKKWLEERIKEGHVFRKLDARGKVFIEYAPLEKAWCPVEGNSYLYIYCLWVAGSFKGNGYGKELLDYAIQEAKNQDKNGICTISSKKKKPYLSEKKFFEKQGFKVVDTIGEYELLSLDFQEEHPKFQETARNQSIDTKAFTIFYSNQCPYVEHSIQEIEEVAKELKIPVQIEKIDSLEKAKKVPCIFQNWANFKDGKFISNTILNASSFRKLVEE